MVACMMPAANFLCCIGQVNSAGGPPFLGLPRRDTVHFPQRSSPNDKCTQQLEKCPDSALFQFNV